jgi:aldose 1-epimerase
MERQLFGSSPDGIPIHAFSIESPAGVRVCLMEYGATIVSIEAPDRTGEVGPITLGFDSLGGYLAPHPFVGATIGRFANRIGGSHFHLAGSSHPLAPNEGRNHLHGGNGGLHRSVWWGEALGSGVRFHYKSPQGEEGYPGTLDCAVEYRLSDEGELSIRFSAETDAATVVNFTNHTYFNLCDGGEQSILDHEIEIVSNEVLETDRDGIPNGHFTRIEGSALDFSRMRRIGERIDELDSPRDGYDHCYVIAQDSHGTASGERSNPEKWDRPRTVARVRDPSSGRVLSLATTQPGLQFYSGNFLDGSPAAKRHGFCLETQHYPDSPNHSHFPATSLAPGERYEETAIYRFGIDTP